MFKLYSVFKDGGLRLWPGDRAVAVAVARVGDANNCRAAFVLAVVLFGGELVSQAVAVIMVEPTKNAEGGMSFG